MPFLRMKKISTLIYHFNEFIENKETESEVYINGFNDVFQYLNDSSFSPSDEVVNTILNYSKSTGYLKIEHTKDTELFFN